MPITLANMATKEASLVITGGPLGEDSINLVYYPNRISTKAIAQLESGLDGLNLTLSQIIKTWDVTNEDGSMYPLDPDSLSILGIPVLAHISQSIAEDIRPN